MNNNASLVYKSFLIVGDFFALVIAFVGAYVLRVKINSTPVAHPIHDTTYLLVFISLLPFWLIIFWLIGLYSQQIYEKRFNELGRLLTGSFIGFLFVIFWNFIMVNPIFPAKLVPVYGFILSFIFLVAFRNLARLIRTELFSYSIGLNHVAVVGNTTISRELIDSMIDSRHSGYKIVGVVGGRLAIGEHHNLRLFSNFQDLLSHVQSPIHTIIQTELYADENRNREILEYAQTHHIAYRIAPGNSELFVGNIEVELFRNSLPVIAIHQTALVGWGRIVKRLFDLIASALLILLTSPILAITSILLAFSNGPIFFRQIRLTRFNREFGVFKFRTLKIEYSGLSPEEAFTKIGKPELIDAYRRNGDQIPDDPRTTRLGNFLRKTSIDELPQLFNVLRGDLSLVGPRALVPQELSLYEKRHTILSVKSGLTGLAQVSGRRNISFEERRKLDLYYVQNWTFWFDLIILVKTIRVILEG